MRLTVALASGIGPASPNIGVRSCESQVDALQRRAHELAVALDRKPVLGPMNGPQSPVPIKEISLDLISR